MRKYWIYTIAGESNPIPAEWLVAWEHHRIEMWFPGTKRPAGISFGDRAVIFAGRPRGFLAAVEVVGDRPEENQDEDGRAQYPYVMRHKLLVAKLADRNVASHEAADIALRRIQRGPHTEISESEYENVVSVLLEAAGRTARS